MGYEAKAERYDKMTYHKAGRSGLRLPAISLGLWHQFGDAYSPENARSMLRAAFDAGIVHFDLANNYGPPPGSAEEMLGRMLKTDFAPYRDELIISTKAGYDMWRGPYGNGGSKKHLTASLNQSLKRLGLDYVDLFYSHRPDLETPLEETMETWWALCVKEKLCMSDCQTTARKRQSEQPIFYNNSAFGSPFIRRNIQCFTAIRKKGCLMCWTKREPAASRLRRLLKGFSRQSTFQASRKHQEQGMRTVLSCRRST